MNPATLTTVIADAYRVDARSVNIFARELRRAGRLTTRGRGRSAPAMTPRDAASLTVALLGTDRPSRAVEALELFGELVWRPSVSHGKPLPALEVCEGSTFLDALEKLFAADLQNDLLDAAPYFEIMRNARLGRIEHVGGVMVFGRPERTDEDRRSLWGIRRNCGLAALDLLKVHVAFHVERREGRPFEELRGGDTDGRLEDR